MDILWWEIQRTQVSDSLKQLFKNWIILASFTSLFDILQIIVVVLNTTTDT